MRLDILTSVMLIKRNVQYKDYVITERKGDVVMPYLSLSYLSTSMRKTVELRYFRPLCLYNTLFL